MLGSTTPALSRHLSRQLTARDDILKASRVLVRVRANSRLRGTDDQRTAGGVQRWCDRDHYHDHGTGDEGAAWRRPQSIETAVASVSQLRSELLVRWHLLE